MENHNPGNMDGDINKYVRHRAPSMNHGWPYPRHQFNQYPHYAHMYQETVPQQVQQIQVAQPMQIQEMQQVQPQPQVQHVQQISQVQQVPRVQQVQALPQLQQVPHVQQVQALPQLQQVQVQTNDVNTTTPQQMTIVSNAMSNQSLGTLHDALTNRVNHNMNKMTATVTVPSQVVTVQTPTIHQHPKPQPVEPPPTQILTRSRMQDLVREVDPNEQLDEDVEEVLLQMADDFVESAITAACLLAKHRKSPTIEVKDLQLHLERNWNMWIPGFGTDELRPYKRSSVNDAHKQRLTLIRKTLKKY